MKNIINLLFVLIVSNAIQAQWVPQDSGTTNFLSSVYFTDANTGYAVGMYGTILKTTDGGSNWVSQNSGIQGHLVSVFFIDELNGFVAGGGILLKTIDGGTQWEIDSLVQGNYICFPDANTGYIGNYKTTDGGINWTYFNAPCSMPSAFFVNADTGYTIPPAGVGDIFKTEDGGSNWITLSTGWTDDGMLNSVFFTSADTGFAIGTVNYYGGILKTNDGGLNWTLQIQGQWSTCIYFFDPNTGYIAYENGAMLKTIDGGNSWFNSYTGTNNYLSSVYFPTLDTGYTVGSDGIILKTTNGGIVGVSDNVITPNKIRIYPNPVKDQLSIECSTISGQTNLSIYDIQGQEIIEMDISDRKIQIDLVNLNAGVYFVKVRNNSITETKKIIKE